MSKWLSANQLKAEAAVWLAGGVETAAHLKSAGRNHQWLCNIIIIRRNGVANRLAYRTSA